jgi:oligopeptide/dipeptide ABC transporter ATP-binding protein
VKPAEPVLAVEDLVVEYRQARRHPAVRAADGVTLAVRPGQTLGLVGESGSGKTTVGRAIVGLAPVRSGQIRFEGADITRAGYRERRAVSARLQLVFQDPYSSLNPARTIGSSLAEPLLVHGGVTASEAGLRVRAMLAQVGLPQASPGAYPSQFSGGQRQRIAIARALMTSPRLVICDEPVTALDLSIQAQVLNLLTDLQAELGLSYLFIAHDLAVVRLMSEDIAVLYRGQVMEQGPAEQVYERPAHPYTRMLLAAVPDPDPRVQRVRPARTVVSQTAVSQAAAVSQTRAAQTGAGLGAGCPFAPRCAHVIEICRTTRPVLAPLPVSPLRVAPAGSETPPGAAAVAAVACHRAADLAAPVPGTALDGIPAGPGAPIPH